MKLGDSVVMSENAEKLLDKFEEAGLMKGEFLNIIHRVEDAASLFYSYNAIAILFALVTMKEVLGEDATIKEALEKMCEEEPRLANLIENKDGLAMLFGEIAWEGVGRYYEASRQLDQSEHDQSEH